MAWNCRYGFGLDNMNGGKGELFRIFFCPSQANQTSEAWQDCWDNWSAVINFPYGTHKNAGKITCQAADKRGARICSQF